MVQHPEHETRETKMPRCPRDFPFLAFLNLESTALIDYTHQQPIENDMIGYHGWQDCRFH